MDEAGDAHYLSFLQLSLGLLVCIGVSALETPQTVLCSHDFGGAVGVRRRHQGTHLANEVSGVL